jgi:nucleotide-binding universal stress UspA family protein
MNAEHYAVQFAKALKAELDFVHVYDLTLRSIPPEPKAFGEFREKLRAAELSCLEQHRNKLFTALDIHDLDGTCYTAEGNVGTEVNRLAEDLKADYIIAGTHGVSGFKKALYGTHSWHIIKKSNIPVLAIPPDGLYTPIKNIVFVTEERTAELPLIKYLVKLAQKTKATVNIYHVSNGMVSKDFEKKVFERFKKTVESSVSYQKLKLHLVYASDIISGIKHVCSEEKANLLVLAQEKIPLLEKIFTQGYTLAGKMSFETTLPLLTIPDSFKQDYSHLWEMFDLNEYLNEY